MPGPSPFQKAIRPGDSETVARALERGDLDPLTLLQWAVTCTDPNLLGELGPHRLIDILPRRTIVKLLLDAGARACPFWLEGVAFGDPHPKRPFDITRRILLRAWVDQAIAVDPSPPSKHCVNSAKQGGLIAAAILNDVPAIQTIVRSGGTDIDGDGIGKSPLIQACAHGSLEAARVLVLEHGASVTDEVLRYAAEWAESRSDHTLFGFLLQQGGNPFAESFQEPIAVTYKCVRPLLLAAMEERLRSEGASGHPFIDRAFVAFVACGYLPGLDLLLTGGFELPGDALRLAVQFGKLESLKRLLRAGALETCEAPAERFLLRAPMERVRSCRSLLGSFRAATAASESLAGLCCNVCHRTGIDRFDLAGLAEEHRRALDETDPISQWESGDLEEDTDSL